jgi:hypothetical protein
MNFIILLLIVDVWTVDSYLFRMKYEFSIDCFLSKCKASLNFGPLDQV